MAQLVERVLGKDEVGGSNPPSSSKSPFDFFKGAFLSLKNKTVSFFKNQQFFGFGAEKGI